MEESKEDLKFGHDTFATKRASEFRFNNTNLFNRNRPVQNIREKILSRRAERIRKITTDNGQRSQEGSAVTRRRDFCKTGSLETPDVNDFVTTKERDGGIASGFAKNTANDCIDETLKSRLRIVAEQVPEVHFLGEISGATFHSSSSSTSFSCEWFIEWGKAWNLLQGEITGQSQYCLTDYSRGQVVWNHPIDLHFVVGSVQGWPRLTLKVWEADKYGRSVLGGYGFVHLPISAGERKVSLYDNPTNTHIFQYTTDVACFAGSSSIEVCCWRPSGGNCAEMESFFLGNKIQLTSTDVMVDESNPDRQNLLTVPTCTIYFKIYVLQRFFQKHRLD